MAKAYRFKLFVFINLLVVINIVIIFIFINDSQKRFIKTLIKDEPIKLELYSEYSYINPETFSYFYGEELTTNDARAKVYSDSFLLACLGDTSLFLTSKKSLSISNIENCIINTNSALDLKFSRDVLTLNTDSKIILNLVDNSIYVKSGVITFREEQFYANQVVRFNSTDYSVSSVGDLETIEDNSFKELKKFAEALGLY